MPASGDREHELVRLIAARDRAALETLYHAYHRRLSRFLVRITHRQDVIDETINDTFWAVWKHADRFRGDSQVSTWIMGIAYRTALKALRQSGPSIFDDRVHAHIEHGSTEPAAAQEVFDWVSKGMSELSLEQRTTMELAYYLGHSLEEIAAIMDCPVSTVKARMFHARTRLRELLPRIASMGSARP